MLKTLMKQIGEYKRAAILTPVFMIGEVLMEVLIPYITANLIDEGIEAANMAAVWKYGLIMLVMAFISLMCGAMSGKYAAYASTGFAANLRRSMYEKIQTYSFANIDKFSTAGLVTRMTTDVTNLQNAFQMIIRMAVRPPMMLILSVIMCITISPSLSTIFLVAVIVLAIALSILIVNTTKIFRQTFEKYDALNASVQENVSAARVVKAFVREDYETDKFRKAAGNLRAMFVKAEALIALNNPVMMMVVYGCIISLSWFGAKQVVSGVLTTGQLTSMFSYIMGILMSLMMLSMVFVMITMSTASAARISEVLNEVPDITDPADPVKVVESGQIDFNDVSFAYNAEGSGENVLQDIDLHIRSGETIGIIGGTGSGKSTLVSLISRLYDATEGSVAVGGVNVKDYDQEALRNKVAVVLQKNVLFSGTILDNLRWGKEDATEEECIKACRLACADEFIEKFPDKYNSWVEQGGNNLSGGQKQRLCIARALLKDPKILILDDSTSAVDTATDAKIRDAFANTIPDTTKLIIAQRISSVQHADRIIVLNDGKVDGFDTHKNLLENNEIYRDIYETQLKGSGDFDEPGREGGN
ncbi:MAG: ABC transporter ATP-binding protein [Erysipelotrichaceae bacterium]|nr:ABC transporter ATP-binding protein [Erysipelotrichaceae bacterium]